MSDNATTGGNGLLPRIAAAIRDESGAARHDRLLLLGGGAVIGALVLLSWVTEDPQPETVAAGASAAVQAPDRSVTSGGSLPPEPPALTDADARRGYVSADYPALQLPPPDTEEALLEALTDRARANDAAALAAGVFGDTPQTGVEAPSDTETVADTGTAPDGT